MLKEMARMSDLVMTDVYNSLFTWRWQAYPVKNECLSDDKKGVAGIGNRVACGFVFTAQTSPPRRNSEQCSNMLNLEFNSPSGLLVPL